MVCRVRRATVVDHIVPVDKRNPMGDKGRLDKKNLQALCKLCHDAKTMRESSASRGSVR